MANERDQEQFDGQTGQSETGIDKQQPTDQQYKANQFGQQSGAQPATSEQGETGLGSQSDQSGLGTQSGGGTSTGQAAGNEGFVGSQGTGGDEYLRQDTTGQSDKQSPTGGTDFAKQGQGAVDSNDEDDSRSTGGSTGGISGGGSGGGGGGSF